MIFRAIFWIGLVAFLMPHQADPSIARSGASPSLLEGFQAAAERNLNRVRDDFAANRHHHGA